MSRKKVCEELLEIDKSEAHGKEIGLGDESDYPWHPIMIPWTDQDPALNPKAFLEKLGAHEELKKEGSIKVIDTSKKFEPDDDEDKIGNLSVFLDKWRTKHNQKKAFKNAVTYMGNCVILEYR